MPGPTYDEAFARKAAENYERYSVPAIGRPVAEDLVEAAALRPGGPTPRRRPCCGWRGDFPTPGAPGTSLPPSPRLTRT